MKLHAMSTSPLYTRIRYFCTENTTYEHTGGCKTTIIPQLLQLTDQSGEQLQVLFPDVHVETTVLQIHLRAATQMGRTVSSNFISNKTTTNLNKLSSQSTSEFPTPDRRLAMQQETHIEGQTFV